jgi:adenylylsulfate kinase-like enzyme
VVRGLAERLIREGMPVAVLEPAEFAAAIVPDHDRSRGQGEIAGRALVLAARLLSEAGVAAIVDGAVPEREGIRLARASIAHVAQVELVCPADICRTRERAVRWGLVAFPGRPRPGVRPSLDLEYESAVAPDLVLYTDALDPSTTVDEVLRLVRSLARRAREARRPCA